MKNRKLKLEKLNNKGMSLVEVLVAMIILSIAGVSFLQSFSYAVRYNALAKEKQKALTYAQSMIEAAKAYSVTELDAGKYNVFSADASDISCSVESSGLHTYVIDNVDNKYTITMTAEPTTSDAAEAVISKNFEMIHNPNKKTDAIFVQDLESDMDAILQSCWSVMQASGDSIFKNYLDMEVSSYMVLDPQYISIDSRTMKISSYEDAGSTVVKVDTTYVYKVTDYEYTYEDALGTTVDATYSTSSPVSVTVSKSDCFESSLGGDLENIYFYYYPMYKSDLFRSYGWVKCDNDAIVISNNIALSNINVYLFKQKLPGKNATEQSQIDVYTNTVETTYSVSVSRDSAGVGLVTLYHNLKGSLYGTAVSSDLYTIATDFEEGGSKAGVGPTEKLEDQPLVYTVKVVVSNDSGDIVTINGSTNIKQ